MLDEPQSPIGEIPDFFIPGNLPHQFDPHSSRKVSVQLFTNKNGDQRLKLSFAGRAQQEMLIPSFDPADVGDWALRIATLIGFEDVPLIFARIRAAKELISPEPQHGVLEDCQAMIEDLWDDDQDRLIGQLVRRLSDATQRIAGLLNPTGPRRTPEDHAEFVAKTREALAELQPLIRRVNK